MIGFACGCSAVSISGLLAGAAVATRGFAETPGAPRPEPVAVIGDAEEEEPKSEVKKPFFFGASGWAASGVLAADDFGLHRHACAGAGGNGGFRRCDDLRGCCLGRLPVGVASG